MNYVALLLVFIACYFLVDVCPNNSSSRIKVHIYLQIPHSKPGQSVKRLDGFHRNSQISPIARPLPKRSVFIIILTIMTMMGDSSMNNQNVKINTNNSAENIILRRNGVWDLALTKNTSQKTVKGKKRVLKGREGGEACTIFTQGSVSIDYRIILILRKLSKKMV